MAIIDEALVALGYEFDDKELKDFQDSTEVLEDSLKAVTAAAIAAATAFGVMLFASAQTTDALGKQARIIGLNVAELDALNFAAEQAIGTSAGVANALETLSIRASEAARGIGGGVEAFGILGVSATDANGNVRNTVDILLETADALNRLETNAQRLELADKLGLRDLNLLLQEGSAGISLLTQEAIKLGVVTTKDAKAAEDFNDEWNRLKRTFSIIITQLATDLLPLVKELLEDFTAWVKENKELIRSGIDTFLINLGTILRTLGLIIGAIIATKFILFIIRMGVAIRALSIAILTLNASFLIIPLLIAAAVALIALIVEDIVGFFQGKDSVTGRAIEAFAVLWKDIWDGIQTGIADAVDFIIEKIDGIFGAFKSFGDYLKNIFNSIIDSISDSFSSLSSAVGDALRAIGILDSDSSVTVSTSGGVLGAGALAAGQTFGSSTNNSNVTNNVNANITINGGDINQVRRTVEEVITGQIRTATDNFSTVLVN
ncbi:hypothetical protein IID23_02280 [Patescibacteria group bacterium]|nr:hypothetical protein [Patescibacteria group bacterium]